MGVLWQQNFKKWSHRWVTGYQSRVQMQQLHGCFRFCKSDLHFQQIQSKTFLKVWILSHKLLQCAHLLALPFRSLSHTHTQQNSTLKKPLEGKRTPQQHGDKTCDKLNLLKVLCICENKVMKPKLMPHVALRLLYVCSYRSPRRKHRQAREGKVASEPTALEKQHFPALQETSAS